MTAQTTYYIDPASGNDSTGDGSSGNPWKTRQGAIDNIVAGAGADTTNGDRIKVAPGTSDVDGTSLDLSSYGTPSFDWPLTFEGDGGLGDFDGNGAASIYSGAAAVQFIDMKLHNTGSNPILNYTGTYGGNLLRCELTDTTGNGINSPSRMGGIVQCYFHNIGGIGINSDGSAKILYNYFANGTNDFDAAIEVNDQEVVARNYFNLDGASHGIRLDSGVRGTLVAHNSMLCSSGTGKGIFLNTSAIFFIFLNNLVEGFSGTGGVGFDLDATTRYQFLVGGNAAYNNTTDYQIQDEFLNNLGDNESLGGSPFAKSGSLPTDFTDANFWNDLYTYFAPQDVGNVLAS